MKSIQSAEVAAVFESYTPKIRRKLLAVRKLIFRTAKATDGVGELEETLKWGEPAYLTSQTKSGSTVRLGWKASAPDRFAIHFHCQTTLVETFREMFPDELAFEGNRSIVFGQDDALPVEPVSICVETALTYHRNKSSRRR